MDKKWVEVEDYPNIIDAEIYEAIEILENVTFFDNALIVDEDEPEDIIPNKPKCSCPIIFRCRNQC